ncbi:MAG: hypothetical protein RL095_1173 [Verrucomicrobiota bacterium]|jgi:phosphoglycolate phosphatase
MTYTHILWDWNGTLVDDVDLCVRTTNNLLARRGRQPIGREQYLRQFTFPVTQFYQAIGFDFAREDYMQMADEWIAEYRGGFAAMSRLNGPVHEALDGVAALGLPQSILSACETRLLHASIEHMGLSGRFTKIFGTGDNAAHGKGELARQVAGGGHFDPASTVLFGDTEHDAEVARDAGIDCVLIAKGHQHPERLRATGHEVLDCISQVPGWLQQRRSARHH